MADDRDKRIAQLEAEAASLRAENSGLRRREGGATEILQAVASSTHDPQQVFDMICSNALRLTGSDRVGIDLFEGEVLRHVATVGSSRYGASAPLAPRPSSRSPSRTPGSG